MPRLQIFGAFKQLRDFGRYSPMALFEIFEAFRIKHNNVLEIISDLDLMR